MVSGFLAIKHGETKRGANLLDDENINARGLQTLVAAGAPLAKVHTFAHSRFANFGGSRARGRGETGSRRRIARIGSSFAALAFADE
jgi:hypothetical protein